VTAVTVLNLRHIGTRRRNRCVWSGGYRHGGSRKQRTGKNGCGRRRNRQFPEKRHDDFSNPFMMSSDFDRH
jgi:hypothetical protein